MKKLFTYLLSAMMILTVGCEKFDNPSSDSTASLEQVCAQTNTNISSLHAVVEALQENDYATNIDPIAEDGVVLGYTITFAKKGSVAIYFGNNNDAIPVVGVKMADDGVYYWTINGEWLLDANGNQIKVLDNNIIPQLKAEKGHWYVSYDGGKTWEDLGKTNIMDGYSMFTEVTYDFENISLTLNDETTLVIPLDVTIPNNQIWYKTLNGRAIELLPHIEYTEQIVSNVYANGKGVITFDRDVTSICERAFYICEKLSSIVIPNSVTSIGKEAFSHCFSLKSITIPDGVLSIGEDTFQHCSSLESITLPNTVTSIGSSAFFGCSSLTSITIPESVTSIGYGAFLNCSSLTSITIPESVTSIGGSAFSSCSSLTSITIPESVTSIGYDAFSYCSSLTSITIPESVNAISAQTFYGCSSLTSITIPESVTWIGDRAFVGCTSLSAFYGKFASADNRCLIVDGELKAFAPNGLNTYTIPEGVTSIGGAVFYQCSSLSNITIPESVTWIGDNVFFNCSALSAFYGKFASADNRCLIVDGELKAFAPNGLNTYTIPEGVTSIGGAVFSQCSSLTSITIPEGVTSIGDSAFMDCSSLTDITIPEGVTSIGRTVFYHCSSLSNITMPESVTSIGDSAFFDCSSLTEITIPAGVTSIAGSAFRYCTLLTTVYCKPTTPPSGVGIDHNPNLNIYVPAESVSAYKSASDWSEYARYIKGYDFSN